MPFGFEGHAGNVLQNALHPLAFFMLSLSLLAVLRHRSGTTRSVLYRRSFALLGVLVALACVSELVQHAVAGRTAAVSDLLADLVGIGTGLLVGSVMLFRVSWPKRLLGVASGVACLVAVLAPGVPTLVAHLTRPDFPVIENGEGAFAMERVASHHGTTVRPGPDARPGGVTVLIGAGRWPGLELVDVPPDWSRCDTLLLDMELSGDAPLSLTLRIDDALHDNTRTDRFNRRLQLFPGRQTVRIPLDAVRRMDRRIPARVLHMDAIERVLLFASSLDAGRVFNLASVRLEGCSRPARELTSTR